MDDNDGDSSDVDDKSCTCDVHLTIFFNIKKNSSGEEIEGKQRLVNH